MGSDSDTYCFHVPAQGSFAWAWVLDERPEERERGVTMDVAMTRFATNRSVRGQGALFQSEHTKTQRRGQGGGGG